MVDWLIGNLSTPVQQINKSTNQQKSRLRGFFFQTKTWDPVVYSGYYLSL